jgi:hypothetical protein
MYASIYLQSLHGTFIELKKNNSKIYFILLCIEVELFEGTGFIH